MVKEHEKKFLEFLSLKSSYDYDPEFVQVIQTHISIVAIAPPFVFKIKKNIKLDFLDYSSLEKRKFFLEREIELNSRLCDNVYIEIVPIYEFEGLLSFEKFFHASGRIYDYALKMNYMKPEYCLINILKTNAFTDSHMDALIQKLGKFYFSQKNQPEIPDNGKPGTMQKMFSQNLEELRKISTGILSYNTLDTLADFVHFFYDRHKDEFNTRYTSGFIKDCHGDLRLEHIYIHDGKICIYDCIEFNDSFRHIDVMNDVAFFLMELDYFGYGSISKLFQRKFIQYVSQQIHNKTGESLLIFYKMYRALVRAKVNCIVSHEEEMPHEKRELAGENSAKFLSLAFKYAITLDQPAIFIVMGKTATGKSTIAKRIFHESGIQVLSTDVIRKKLAKVDIHRETPADIKSTIYSSEFTEKVYNALLTMAEEILSRESAVILDGTFSKVKYRKLVLEKFGKKRLFFIEVDSSDEDKIKRLKQRETTGAISDARASDKKKIDDLYEAPVELPDSFKIYLYNSGDINDVATALYKKIFQLNY